MSKIEIRIIDKAHKADINIPNESFSLFGRMLPSYLDGKWDYTTERFTTIEEMCFPDENYDYDKMTNNSIFVGAYEGEKCIGLAILQQAWFKYMYLCDLKVSKQYRGKNIGKKLIEKLKEIALEQGYNGIYAIGQDNNLGACLFYIKNGFVIGGLDTNVYKGTKQEGKADILFYADSK
jgi:ribosomal protein S18 acetylase RimI-like enzyme